MSAPWVQGLLPVSPESETVPGVQQVLRKYLLHEWMEIICPSLWFLCDMTDDVFSQPVWIWYTNVSIALRPIPAQKGCRMAQCDIHGCHLESFPASECSVQVLCTEPAFLEKLSLGWISFETVLANHLSFCFCLDSGPLLLPECLDRQELGSELIPSPRNAAHLGRDARGAPPAGRQNGRTVRARGSSPPH